MTIYTRVYEEFEGRWRHAWHEVVEAGGSQPALTDYIGVSFAKNGVDGDPAGFYYLQFADIDGSPVIGGDDLTVVDGGDKAQLHTTEGGSFDMGVVYTLRLTATPNDDSLRWISMYADSANVDIGRGLDGLSPMIHDKSIDSGARAVSPYIDLPADTSFGAISFIPVVGSADDTFNVLAFVAVWKIAPLP